MVPCVTAVYLHDAVFRVEVFESAVVVEDKLPGIVEQQFLVLPHQAAQQHLALADVLFVVVGVFVFGLERIDRLLDWRRGGA